MICADFLAGANLENEDPTLPLAARSLPATKSKGLILPRETDRDMGAGVGKSHTLTRCDHPTSIHAPAYRDSLDPAVERLIHGAAVSCIWLPPSGHFRGCRDEMAVPERDLEC
jgi:hypothetical protein